MSVADMVAHGGRHADPARFGQSLQSGSDVHPVAVDVPFLDDHIAEIYADTEDDPLVLGNAGIAIQHSALDRHGTGDSLYYARELTTSIPSPVVLRCGPCAG